MTFNASVDSQLTQHMLFGWVDHLSVALMLDLSAAIGIYFGVFGRAKNTAQVDYLHGGKRMRAFPVAVSQVSSHTSGTTLMGVPAEVYLYGSVYGWVCISVIIFALITNYVFLPVFFDLQLTSTYEYLERRFSRTIRLFASGFFTLNLVLHMPLYVYMAAIALSQVSGISVHWITPLVCTVCVFYTMLGGLKTVVWTDFLQSGVTLAAFIAVLILGVVSAGGFAEVWRAADEGGRVAFFVSFWAVVIGATGSFVGGCAVHQGMVQKFMSLPDLVASRKTLAGFTFGIILMKVISVFTGFLLYATYRDCDPVKTHEVSRPDQLLPFYVMRVAGHVPGLPGLFVAGIFGAALSSMSGTLNALSGTIYEDFLLPLMPKRKTYLLVNLIMQAIVLVVRIITVGMVYIVERLGTILEGLETLALPCPGSAPLAELSQLGPEPSECQERTPTRPSVGRARLPLGYSVGGVTNGALLGIFTLGMLVPSANTKGAIAGSLCGMTAVAILITGAQHATATGRVRYLPLPTSVEGCPGNVTNSVHAAAAAAATSTSADDVPLVFRLSYMYYTVVGALIVVTVGWVVSRLTGPLKLGEIDPRLLAPQVRPDDHRRAAQHDPAAAVELLPSGTQHNPLPTPRSSEWVPREKRLPQTLRQCI
ncbi:sodium-coupled monocarboxylate transporter 1-like [Schistocerca serialis cubense]|uniref:sodium-coupled monocarboxylate transporter 1-like n=1 Tax=Schistocerca serialis cubense TaxID=2023355 RepID=UPI00214E0DBC|nr:sodium-coupled monocarboxylate transporter 1-like [Schistocerca serialis cubense]